MLNAVADGYGGLEHRNSTALICGRRDLPRQGEPRASEGYTTLLGLISHEYFHTWNVKRLKPAEFAPYDYTKENHTRMLWFFEGFTSYYDDQFLLRTGLIDAATYLKLLAKTVNQVLATPGRLDFSVAQASFDAWTRSWGAPTYPTNSAPRGALLWATQTYQQPLGRQIFVAPDVEPPNLIDEIVAQDIQLNVRAALSSPVTPRTNNKRVVLDVGAQWAPKTHVRPDWYQLDGTPLEAQFPGGEVGGR